MIGIGLGGYGSDRSPRASPPGGALTLHMPPRPSKERALRAGHFQAMAGDAIFINTSREICLDEEALVAETGKGRVFAFLEVSMPAPALVDSPLRTMPNVVYNSHLAGKWSMISPRLSVQVTRPIHMARSP